MQLKTAIDDIAETRRLFKRKPTRAYTEGVVNDRNKLEALLFPVVSRHLLRAKRAILRWAETEMRKQDAPPDPNAPDFWAAWADAFAADLNAALVPWLVNVFSAEVSMAVTPTLGFVVSKEAVKFAQQYTYNLINLPTGIDATTRTRLQTAMSTWWANDEDMRSLRSRVADIFGADRADLIATTEATRVSALSRQDFYQARGIKLFEWRTTRAANVCEFCQSMDGEKIDISASPDSLPPAASHPGCHCSVVPWEEGATHYNEPEWDST